MHTSAYKPNGAHERVRVPGERNTNATSMLSSNLRAEQLRASLSETALQPIEHEFIVGDKVYVTLDNVLWSEGVVIQCPPSDLKFDPPPSELVNLGMSGIKTAVSGPQSRVPLKSILRNGSSHDASQQRNKRPHYKQWLVRARDEHKRQYECLFSPLEGNMKPKIKFWDTVIQSLLVDQTSGKSAK